MKLLWWGLFERELYVEHGDDRRFGPYTPVDGPIPLHRYRTDDRPNQTFGLAQRWRNAASCSGQFVT